MDYSTEKTTVLPRPTSATDAQGIKRTVSGKLALADQILVCEGYAPGIRWRSGERLEQLFEERCDWMRESGQSEHLAVQVGNVALTYNQLDAQANQLARYLLTQGAQPGDRIGLLFDQAVPSYVAMLAVLKINAAYVPLDVGFPPDRLAYIVQDANVRIVLSLSLLRDRFLQYIPAQFVCTDEVAEDVAAQNDHRLTKEEKGVAIDELCYIIYTSGSTGRPKGVAVAHASICNFVRVAAEVYEIEAQDRMYQGMTIAFDFSIEEIWVPLISGATLVPKPGGSALLGHELWEYLQINKVTAMCCVPTLLATLDEDLPCLRFLLVSGEACPQDLVTRWHKRGRRFLNVYGPTEATVTATWRPLHPNIAVTLGIPLPTYSIIILDPSEPQVMPTGEIGEIGIAGIGLAIGYVNRDDLTQRAFIPDFLDIEDNPSGRIYRTGDLGRINAQGEIEYYGRIDTQVKIRGYRIELTEIESVLAQVPGVAQAVVNPYEPEPGVVELVGYYRINKNTTSVSQEYVYEQLRARLPRYMVPAYLEELEVIPMLPSNKADRKNLPAPKGPRSLSTQNDYVSPTTYIEHALADILASSLRVERVSIESHFFDDLGASSLLMARFCSQVREQAVLPNISMKDVYLNPTIRSLATALEHTALTHSKSQPLAEKETIVPASTGQYVLCAILQCLLFFGYTYLIALAITSGYEWITASTGWLTILERSFIFAGASFLGMCAFPILAKWMLIGRWKSEEIRIWSLAYVRFWTVKTLIRSNPLVLFIGSPLYTLYLKALGARIGKRVLIFSQHVPVCTDLLTIGDDTVICKDSFFSCYRAHAGMIQTGIVTMGKNVFVGDMTVIDIGTSLGHGAQLGHASSLYTSQAIPSGQSWNGSPAQRTTVNYRAVAPTRCGPLRRIFYSFLLLLNTLVLYGLGVSLIAIVFSTMVFNSTLQHLQSMAFTNWLLYWNMLVLSFVVFFGTMLVSMVFVLTVPRVLNLALKPDVVYPLYGFRYWAQQVIMRITNAKLFTDLFGDSSYIVYYLRALGYNLEKVVQTGSNFGMGVKHDTPYLSTVGSGTMVSDGLSIINAHFSSTSFSVSRASIGARNYLGNNIAYPASAKTGSNCLLATKVMVPLDGEIRENVGLLGSPCFEIPRSVQHDSQFDYLKNEEEVHRRISAKNKYNLATIGLFLFVRWFYLFGIFLLILAAARLPHGLGTLMTTIYIILTVILSNAYFILVQHITTRFRALTPQYCSIYEPYFWWHERLWKTIALSIAFFNGTPFKSMLWRLVGVRCGRRVFDDGCYIPERSLVTIGNDCTLNEGCVIQCHSMEESIFKSDYTTIGDSCTLGIDAFVHYGVTIGDGAVLAPDSFVMKGEEVGPYAQWQGNPAKAVQVLLEDQTQIAALVTRSTEMLANRATSFTNPSVRSAKYPKFRRDTNMETFRSQELFQQVQTCIPAGTSNPARTFLQVGGKSPIFMQLGKEACLYDVDSNAYIDYVLGWGPLILGHAHPEVVASLQAQIARGTSFGTPTESEATLAQMIKNALPSIDKLRFVNSGTEATMAAVELAKVHTKRERIIKFKGCYHGWYGPLLTGSPYRPAEGSNQEVLLAEYNDLTSVDELLGRYKGEIAAVILEPVAGNMGVVPPKDGFLQGLRELCDAHESLLIFDEVMTGFRVGYSGAQGRFAVTPDLTCLGKIIGGGLPIGAYGGREDIMASVAPSGSMYQGGTYSGNPLSLTAGITTLRLLEKPSVYEQLECRAKALCKNIQASAHELAVPVWINQVGAMFCIFFQDGPVTNLDSVQRSDTEAFTRFFWALLERGVYLPPSQFEAAHLSVMHTSDDIERTSQIARDALRVVADSCH